MRPAAPSGRLRSGAVAVAAARRRPRRAHGRRRDRLLALLAACAPALAPIGISAGLGALLELPEGGPTSSELVAEAERRSIEIDPLGPYYHDGRAPRDGVVLGYGALPEHDVGAGFAALGELLAAMIPS
jgi:GntR family transcriptional regulator/MocR family aminotransferase